ncbi:MAG: tRNA preQ1(34) S-adenosylmethionine ribosyltransferase-isomerase QueA [Desulfurivibrionaceae bacterium]|nr:tRNA preQ1(34) S-adenosylmethionine ribosyltransferase-isomerase QueA [Desulfobulbales bacterium]MDT8334058.1 tRNA preQ1(34) S-adenosylmethionine ribosyltransferase-isomerase QueA [Desulfurivibrionaceae bacterium]
MFDLEDYNYHLPQESIAQEPAVRRDESRLLILGRNNSLTDGMFGDIVGLLAPGDLLVVNDTKVFPARLIGSKETGGKVELFLLNYPLVRGNGTEQGGRAEVVCLLKSSKRPVPGSRLLFGAELDGEVLEYLESGKVKVALRFRGELEPLLNKYGQVPLPPYIRREESGDDADRERYQTVYARETGAVAAPTAGLHFTPELLAAIKARGVLIASITLHVGYGTFSPVRVKDIRDHEIHREYVRIAAETVKLVNNTGKAGGRIWAVGTTTARALEDAADEQGLLGEKEDWCDLYIYPGYRFKVVDNLITNFHLPGSSLLFLVSAMAGYHEVMAAYRHAVDHGYRFYSYGDAMAIITE